MNIICTQITIKLVAANCPAKAFNSKLVTIKISSLTQFSHFEMKNHVMSKIKSLTDRTFLPWSKVSANAELQFLEPIIPSARKVNNVRFQKNLDKHRVKRLITKL